MGRPLQQLQVFGIQDRRANAQARRPWVVRRAVDGQERSTSFRTHVEADRYRSVLVRAAATGEKFDPATGEPESWKPKCGRHPPARVVPAVAERPVD